MIPTSNTSFPRTWFLLAGVIVASFMIGKQFGELSANRLVEWPSSLQSSADTWLSVKTKHDVVRYDKKESLRNDNSDLESDSDSKTKPDVVRYDKRESLRKDNSDLESDGDSENDVEDTNTNDVLEAIEEAIEEEEESSSSDSDDIFVEPEGTTSALTITTSLLYNESCPVNPKKVNPLDKGFNRKTQRIERYTHIDQFVLSYDASDYHSNSVNTYDHGIHLVTTWFYEEHLARYLEIDEVIRDNLKNDKIDFMHILYDGSNITGLLKIKQDFPRKLHLVHVKQQPTYSMYFFYINRIIKAPGIAIISNVDIFFDKSLKCVEPFLNTPEFKGKMAMSLTREGCMKKKYIGSHDTFVFQPPISCNVIGSTHHFQNRIGAENNVIYHLQVMDKFFVLNPCGQIETFHRHFSNIRRYKLKNFQRDRADKYRDKRGKIIYGTEKGIKIQTHGNSFPCGTGGHCFNNVNEYLATSRNHKDYFHIDCKHEEFKMVSKDEWKASYSKPPPPA